MKCASPEEMIPIINIRSEIDNQINIMQRKLCSYQISQLREEEKTVKKRVAILRDKGLYDNYGAISRLSADLKKIQSKISSLEIKDSMGGDAQLE